MEKFLELVLRWLTSAYTHQPPLDFHTFQFQCFLILIVLLYYLICIQYNILLLIRNATSNNHHFHSNSTSTPIACWKTMISTYRVITLITYTKFFYPQPNPSESKILQTTDNAPNMVSIFCKMKQHEDHLTLSQHIMYNATSL